MCLNRYGITSTTISAFDFRFPYLGGSIFFIPRLSNELTIYPPIRDPRSGTPLADKTMYDLKSLGSRHASLIESEAVDPMEHVLDLALSKQFLRKLF